MMSESVLIRALIWKVRIWGFFPVTVGTPLQCFRKGSETREVRLHGMEHLG